MKKIIIKGIIYLLVLGAGIWIGNQGIKLLWGKADLNTKLSTVENKDVSLDDLYGVYLSDTNENSNSSEISFAIESDQEITIGKFNQFNIQLNAHEDFTQSQILVSIDAASINTGNNMRDEHLLADDFFNTEKFADCALKMMSMQFEASNKVAASSGGTEQKIIVQHQNDYDIFDAMIDLSGILSNNSSSSSSSGSNCQIVQKAWGADMYCN